MYVISASGMACLYVPDFEALVTAVKQSRLQEVLDHWAKCAARVPRFAVKKTTAGQTSNLLKSESSCHVSLATWAAEG